MKIAILAGGSGTRLWPLSRQAYPKQFLKIGNDYTLLQKTAIRSLKNAAAHDLMVISNSDYRFLIRDQLAEAGIKIGKNIILEPQGRNTAPAIGLAAAFARDVLGSSDDEVVFVCPSDHLISPEDRFASYVGEAEKLAREGYIVTFGVNPTRPETGYGYIKEGPGIDCSGLSHKAKKVARFVEKPDLETAQSYLLEGGYYYNSGMFAFSLKTIFEELNKYAPEIKVLLDKGFDYAIENFAKMPKISIDYAIMEKSDRVAVLPMDVMWSDVGSWDSFFDVMDKDEGNNVKTGDIIDIETKNSFIHAGNRLVATIGLQDLIIVDTADALLVANRNQSQKVKEVVEKLKASGREALTTFHTTVARPWGSFTTLEEGQRYKIKRIQVLPGEWLSLQRHSHRSEHWVVVKGTATVRVDDKEIFLHENESVYVPKSSKHRLGNTGKIPVEIIEVQVGEYVGEDDIERFDDIYQRS
ncbi:MAG: mannose-1-phosphate guanylyltransferase/mannose-6-phosphate isomerase [Candidatus Rifleibacteriota bacterium]